jgi:hypothetical protein
MASPPTDTPADADRHRLLNPGPRQVLLFLLGMVVVLFLRDLWVQVRAVEPLPYSEFAAQLKAGNVDSLGSVDL